MHSVDASVETPPPTAACPTCGEAAKHAGYVTEKGIVTGNYTCTLNHIWITRWLAVAA